MSWPTIRDEMKVRLDTISGLSARDTMPDSLPDRDTATVLPGEPVLVPAGHIGYTAINIRVLVRCARGKLKDSQDAIDPYLWPTGASSIVAAVFGDRTLNSTVDDIQFVSVDGYSGEEDTHAIRANVNFLARVSAT